MCGCNSGGSDRSNAARMTTDELVAAAQQRADERRLAELQERVSQEAAMANASQQ